MFCTFINSAFANSLGRHLLCGVVILFAVLTGLELDGESRASKHSRAASNTAAVASDAQLQHACHRQIPSPLKISHLISIFRPLAVAQPQTGRVGFVHDSLDNRRDSTLYGMRISLRL